MVLNYQYTDSGFCRVVYKTPDNFWYCIQDNGSYNKTILQVYACTKDGEPSYIVDTENKVFQHSPGKDNIDIEVNHFINNLDVMSRQL